MESTPTAPWRVSQSVCLVRHGLGAVAALGVTQVAARRGHRAVGRRVLVVVADQALLHGRVRARPLRHGVAVRGGGVAALAEEARLDEVLVIHADAAAADRLEQVLVGVAAAARLVEHVAEDGLLVVAGDLRDGLLQRLELGREEEERTRLGVALLAVDAVDGPTSRTRRRRGRGSCRTRRSAAWTSPASATPMKTTRTVRTIAATVTPRVVSRKCTCGSQRLTALGLGAWTARR